jgi:hypothetical protein
LAQNPRLKRIAPQSLLVIARSDAHLARPTPMAFGHL